MVEKRRAKQPCSQLEVLLESLRPRVRNVFLRFRIPESDTEDILQQALLSMIVKADEIRDREAWLLGTLRKGCLQYWRRQRRALHEAVDLAVLEWLAAPVVGGQERRELLRDVHHLLDGLPAKCRHLLWLRYHQGLELAEIADRMGYRRSSMGKITSRCMARLIRRALQLDCWPLGG